MADAGVVVANKGLPAAEVPAGPSSTGNTLHTWAGRKALQPATFWSCLWFIAAYTALTCRSQDKHPFGAWEPQTLGPTPLVLSVSTPCLHLLQLAMSLRPSS